MADEQHFHVRRASSAASSSRNAAGRRSPSASNDARMFGRSWRHSSSSLFATPIEQDPTTPGHVIEGCTQIQEATNAYANPCAVPPGAPANQCVLNNVPFTVAFDLGTAPSGQTNNIPSAIGVRGSNIYVGFCGYCDVVTGGLPFHSGIATSVGGWHIISNPLCANCGTPDGTLPQRYITSTQLDPVDPNTVYVSMGGYGRRWIPRGAIGEPGRSEQRGRMEQSRARL